MKTNRQKALDYIKDMKIDVLEQYLIDGHKTNSHRWVEIEPDGNVHDTEESNNNNSHWIDYPNKEVASIYEVCRESAEPCNCDMCTEYRHFNEMSKEEFIESYSEDSYEYWESRTLDEALLEYEIDNGRDAEDIRDEMLEAIDEIEYGYFDDEEEKR